MPDLTSGAEFAEIILQYDYRLKTTGYSSERYGPCEVCGEHCSEVFYQVESKGGSRHKCRDLFGHETCLVAARR